MLTIICALPSVKVVSNITSYKTHTNSSQINNHFSTPARATIHEAVVHFTAKYLEVSIGCYSDRIALSFDKLLDSGAAEVPVNFQIGKF